MNRAEAKIVPKLLNFEEKQCCMDIARKMLTRPDLPKNFAMTLKLKPNHPNGSVVRSNVRSNVKVLLTIFFDCNGVVHQEFLLQGRTVSMEYYLEVMCGLWTELWKNQLWVLHYDNAPAHKSMFVHKFLAKNKTLLTGLGPR